MNETEVLAEAFEGDLDLGAFLGRHQAFGLISGRCSAAQAVCLREIRDKKLYKNRCPDWNQFCREYLHMTRPQVQHIINLLNEFGPDYFELSQLTRVSADTYRAIRPALEDKALHVDGEVIPLIPENAARVSAAVAELRKAARPEPSVKDRLSLLNRRFGELIDELTELANSPRHHEELSAILVSLQTRLDRLELQI